MRGSVTLEELFIDYELKKVIGSILGFFETNFQRLLLFTCKVTDVCFNFAVRCKDKMAKMYRKTRDFWFFLHSALEMNLEFQSLKVESEKLSEEITRLDVENEHCMETIGLMQYEIDNLELQRAEKEALEEDNNKLRQQLQDVTELISYLVTKEA